MKNRIFLLITFLIFSVSYSQEINPKTVVAGDLIKNDSVINKVTLENALKTDVITNTIASELTSKKEKKKKEKEDKREKKKKKKEDKKEKKKQELILQESVQQKEPVPAEKFLVKAGANYSLYSSKRAKWKGEISYQLGFGLEIPISKKFYMQPEILYVNAEAISNKSEYWKNNLITVDDKLTTSMISFPVLFKYKFSKKFEFELGPQFNYIENVTRTRNDGKKKEKPSRAVNNFDYGATAGISFNITKKIGVNARYYMGLTELDKRPGIYLAYTDSDIGKVSLAALSFYYKF